MTISEFKKAIEGKEDQEIGIVFGPGEDDTLYFYEFNSSEGIHVIERDGTPYIIKASRFDWINKVLFLKKGTRRKMRKTYDSKRPKTKAKHVGVEIEFVSKLSPEEVSALIANEGLEDYVTCKDDGSIDCPDEFPVGHEICILGNERNIHKLVERVCKVIKHTSRVNGTCGLHVHLDMRDRDVNQAYANLYAVQPLLYAMCPISRMNGTYSTPVEGYTALVEDDWDTLGDRYVGVNKVAYETHSTLEVRIHSGTINPIKISNWVKLLIKIADKPFADASEASLINDYKALKKKIRLVGKLEKYVLGRIEKFKEGHEKRGDKSFVLAA